MSAAKLRSKITNEMDALYPRLQELRELMTDLGAGMREIFEARSEAWRKGPNGAAHHSLMVRLEEADGNIVNLLVDFTAITTEPDHE